MHDVITREKGLFALGNYGTYDARCCQWFLDARETDDALDFIEVSFRLIDRIVGDLNEWELQNRGKTLARADAIDELNGRFREELLGYQSENGELIRVDNQFTHTEIVKPALRLLAESIFERANEDFLKAHEHYRPIIIIKSVSSRLCELLKALLRQFVLQKVGTSELETAQAN